jgi:hypothetical protein
VKYWAGKFVLKVISSMCSLNVEPEMSLRNSYLKRVVRDWHQDYDVLVCCCCLVTMASKE